jgi:phosphoribosyl 1,2-cyclic phosphodiesterase
VTVDNPFHVTFWGVRGSIPCPGPDTFRYGGNTSCLEVRCGARRFILDGGTGLRPLGLAMAGQGLIEADIFFTHTHFDHICGLPFFGPAYVKGNKFKLWAGHLLPEKTLHYVLAEMMMAPLFPIPITVFDADLSFHDFRAGETFTPAAGVTVRTAPLNHPNRATGYRIDYAGKSICYITDTEHEPGKPDQNILGLIEGADLFIYDATYTETEYPNHKGWGHSTWEEGAKLADLAKVKRLVIFHHDPSHDDVFMDRVAAAAEARRAGTIVAREGTTLEP